jgi:phospho-N-acetylmuramoyl-pentapeptide-transferase
MLYYLSPFLEKVWGPFRLLHSHAFLLAIGTFTAAIAVKVFLPKLWNYLPRDKGKAILGKDGMKSQGKPTGAGFITSLITLPIILLFVPLTVSMAGVLLFLYATMIFGYLDDRATVAWGQLKKGLLDAVVSIGTASFIYTSLVHGTGVHDTISMWVPFTKVVWNVAWYIYIPLASMLLFVSLNSTNCSDGVDGLAGSLSMFSLVAIAILLYVIIGNMPAAQYLLIPIGATAARLAAKWAILLMTASGGIAGYLWWNSEPSKVLMGDAGSRFLGLLVGAGILITGNPFLLLAFAPVVIANGGLGLVKIIILRCLKMFKIDTRATTVLTEEEKKKQNKIVKALFAVRFPLHDHMKRNHGWSNAQVLMRFMLVQMFLVPLLFLIFVKIR